MPFFQDTRVLTIPSGGSVDYELPTHVPLDNLTIWVLAAQPTNAITVQPTIGQPAINFGGSTAIPNTGPFADTVFVANNPTDGRRLIPDDKGPEVRPFRFRVNFSAGAADEVVTVYALANELAFGA